MNESTNLVVKNFGSRNGKDINLIYRFKLLAIKLWFRILRTKALKVRQTERAPFG